MQIKPWNEKKLFANPKVWPADEELKLAVTAAAASQGRLYLTEGDKIVKFRQSRIKPIWIEGDKCEGKPTRHFAWYGLPAGAGTGKAKVPAMVLVHGGGGTAFCKWVEMWNRRGYAAIAMDTCGKLPIAPKYGEWTVHEFSHNSRWGDFANAGKPAADQWCYHAVTAVIRAHSFLRTLPQVDARRIGITGVSWGGYLTCIASAIDSRFRFAAPVYGCGFLDCDSPWKPELDKLPAKLKKRWLKYWDPCEYLPMSSVPTLWTTGSNDFAYNLKMLGLSKSACGAKAMLSVHVRYSHSHADGWKLHEPYAFADSFCMGGPKLSAPKIKEKSGVVTLSGKNISSATLCCTESSGNFPERYWKQLAMRKNGEGNFEISLPQSITAWFVNVTDAYKNLLSSDITFMAVQA